jgi:hypothetical protein
MQKLFLACSILIISQFAFSQEKIIKEPNAQERKVGSDFHAVAVHSGIDLYITQGENAVAVSAKSEEYRDRIKTVVEGGVLKIYIDENWKNWSWGWHDRKLKAYVSVKALDALTASGGSDIYANDGLNVNSLQLQCSGGSDFHGKVTASDMEVHQSGGSDVHISGKTGTLKVHTSGGGDFHGYDLQADIVNVSASGGSDAQVTVMKELSVKATGGSDVHYKGPGVIKDISSGGGGGVSRRN